MNLTYNGIRLQICHFLDFQENDLYSDDGVDYIATHYVIDVQCIFNPAATASFQNQVQQPPAGQRGDIPAVSIKRLSQALWMPCQTLIMDVAGTIVLESPRTIVLGNVSARAPIDANNGPRPTRVQVTTFSGEALMIVRFRVETWLNIRTPAPALSANSCLLSNRWESTENIREDFTSVIHCSGTAIFRRDYFEWARANAAALFGQPNAPTVTNPDSLRAFCIPPPKNGFQRKNLTAALSSDGTRLRWSFDDEQQIYQLDPGAGIYKVRGYTYSDLDWTGGKLGIAWLRLPEMYAGIHAEAWGRPRATRQQIANALVQIVAAAQFPVEDRAALRARLQIDFPERHGSVDITIVSNGIVGGAFNIFGAKALKDLPNVNLFQDFNVAGLWTFWQQGAAGIPVIQPGGDGKAGDVISLLLAQTFYVPSVVLANAAAPPKSYQ